MLKPTFVALCLTTTACAADLDGTGGGLQPSPRCEDYVSGDAAQVRPVDFVVVNDGLDPIYLDTGSCGAAPFELYVGGTWTPVRSHDPCGGTTCEDLQFAPSACPFVACAEQVVVIAPGGRFPISWDGLVAQDVQMPLTCYAEPAAAENTCTMFVPARSDSFELGLRFISADACDAVGGCSCMANEDGYCTSSVDMRPDGMRSEVRTAFTYPEPGAVEIVVAP